MKIKSLAITTLLLSSSLYSQSCYSVGLINVKKINKNKLYENFSFPKECIIAEIGNFASVRCGCHKYSRDAQKDLRTKYKNYDGAYVVQTRKDRFDTKVEKTEPEVEVQETKHIEITKTPIAQNKIETSKPQKTTEKEDIKVPQNTKFEYVKLDPKTGKLIIVTAEEDETTTQNIETQEPKKVQEVLDAKPVVKKHTTKRIAPKKPHQTKIQKHKKVIQKQLPSTEIKDEKILNKIKILKTKLKAPEPKPAQHKKTYFHEEDKDISDILEFIEAEDDFDVDVDDNADLDEKDSFYDDIDEEDDINLDD